MKFRVNHAVKHWLTLWDKEPRIAWTLSILWLLLISWLAFLWNLGSTGLVDETEPLFAEASRQMTVTGDWITPYFNGKTRFDKPALIYWCQAIAYKLIGVNEWAVRLPSALAAIALTVLGFYTLRYFGFPRPSTAQLDDLGKDDHAKIYNRERQMWLSAWIGAALIALNPETIAWARVGVSDMLLSGCMGSALLAFFLGYAQGGEGAGENVDPNSPERLRASSAWYLVFYVLVGLAVLTKGPVGIVLPVLIIAAFLLYLGKFREVLREMRPVRGLLIVAAIALPWYVLVAFANGEAYINSFFGYHNLERFTGVVNGHRAPWYFYFLVVLLGFAPWSIYLPVAIQRLRFWQQNSWRDQPRSTHLGLFALFWFAGVFGFFTIAVTKLPSYVLPLMPAAAILLALLFSSEFFNNSKLKTQNSKLLLLSGIFNVLFLLLIAGAFLYIPQVLGYDPAVPNLRPLVQQSGLPLKGSLIWGLTAVAATLLLIKSQWRWLWSVNLIGFVAFVIFVITPAYFLMDQARQLPLRQLSAIAAQVAQPGEELIMIGFTKPSVAFYTKRYVNYFDQAPDAMKYIKAIATTDLNPPTSLILSKPKILPEAGLQPNEYRNLGQVGAYQLSRVPKQVIARTQLSKQR
ncbi:MAG: glycosyltransferase family 39 protein [Aphanothece sp. CMT-3BRIN-NPC111]|jgi:4-amino-4-deoxy-L-arabinose transferase-like glycosyltransferase|nr:glycosyltransferase family 39 protein [Aphanothece sp. CMT-3BRIN-NPC111]